MWSSDVFTVVTGGVPNVPRPACQISGLMPLPGDLSCDSSCDLSCDSSCDLSCDSSL
jgi:hypothetical protein